MCTFIIDFPMAVAVKNVRKEIPKLPQVIPAKSNRGFGIEAQRRIAINPYFYKLLYIMIFNLDIKLLSSYISSIS